MGVFDDYCMELGIKLYVLPARKSKMNGYAERAKHIVMNFGMYMKIPDTIEGARKLLRKFEYKYNCERMHQRLLDTYGLLP